MRKRSIYTYDLYTNEGKKVILKKGSNFGYIESDKTVTTKGISQIDAFSNKGVVNGVLKVSSSILDIWNIFALKDIMYGDSYGDFLPLSLSPWGFASDLLTQFVIKPEFEATMATWRDEIYQTFQLIKQKGLEACVNYIDSPSGRLAKYSIMKVGTKTVQQMIQGNFLTLNDVTEHEGGNPIHTVFYRETYDSSKKADSFIIDCIFIDDQLLQFS